jgi:hypothetical protein
MDHAPFPNMTDWIRDAPNRTPLARMTDDQLAAELKLLGDQWDESHKDEEGHGGSPGEWIVERMGELETEQKRRRRAV